MWCVCCLCSMPFDGITKYAENGVAQQTQIKIILVPCSTSSTEEKNKFEWASSKNRKMNRISDRSTWNWFERCRDYKYIKIRGVWTSSCVFRISRFFVVFVRCRSCSALLVHFAFCGAHIKRALVQFKCQKRQTKNSCGCQSNCLRRRQQRRRHQDETCNVWTQTPYVFPTQ